MLGLMNGGGGEGEGLSEEKKQQCSGLCTPAVQLASRESWGGVVGELTLLPIGRGVWEGGIRQLRFKWE